MAPSTSSGIELTKDICELEVGDEDVVELKERIGSEIDELEIVDDSGIDELDFR